MDQEKCVYLCLSPSSVETKAEQNITIPNSEKQSEQNPHIQQQQQQQSSWNKKESDDWKRSYKDIDWQWKWRPTVVYGQNNPLKKRRVLKQKHSSGEEDKIIQVKAERPAKRFEYKVEQHPAVTDKEIDSSAIVAKCDKFGIGNKGDKKRRSVPEFQDHKAPFVQHG